MEMLSKMQTQPNSNKTIVNQRLLGGVLACLLTIFSLPAVASDPWENTNTRIYRINKFLDSWLLRPLAVGYNNVMPSLVRQGVGNFFSNIDDVNVLANDLLQLKLRDAATDSGRLIINTSVGFAGVIDVASSVGLSKNEEDFGQTFGRWGVGAGPYVVLPLFGPSSVRDSIGLVLDTVFNPIQYHKDESLRTTLLILGQLDDRASILSMEGLISGDEYLFIREAYLQQREYLVNDGAYYDDLDDF
ncbi:MAG: VacJ family lipoprotein [Pseudomonadota bacterium]